MQFSRSGWTRIHPSFLCSERRHDYCTVPPSVSLQKTETELKLMWAKRLDVTKARSRILLQVGQDSVSPGPSCCLCCSCWPSPGLALCCPLQVAASGGSSQLATEVERELSFPRCTKSESRVSLDWLFHVAVRTQSRLWGIKYADCSSLSHMTTLDVGGGWGRLGRDGKFEFCPNFMDWEVVGIPQSKTRSFLLKEGKMSAVRAKPTTALHVGSAFSLHEVVPPHPPLQKSLHFAMWYYLPRTLHLCLRKINTQPICRLYFP